MLGHSKEYLSLCNHTLSCKSHPCYLVSLSCLSAEEECYTKNVSTVCELREADRVETGKLSELHSLAMPFKSVVLKACMFQILALTIAAVIFKVVMVRIEAEHLSVQREE